MKDVAFDFASDYAARPSLDEEIAWLTTERDRLRKRLAGVEAELQTALEERAAISPVRLPGVR